MSRAATSRLKVNPPLGMRPSLEFRRIHELRVDPSYQRSIEAGTSQTLIRRIAMFWDWGLCQPLSVAKRADGSLMVVDGQHRLEAARLRGDIYDLPCVVTAYANAGDEAAAFVALNQQRRPLSRLDLFKAALAAEDEEASVVMRLIEDAGLSLAPHSNPTAWKPGMISNVSGVADAYRSIGAAATKRALSAMLRGFPDVVLRYAGTIFPGIAGFMAEEARAKRPVEQELLTLVLQGASQREWVSEIQLEQAAHKRGRKVAAQTVIASAYREAEDEVAEAA
jgi:hypothetical protein